MFVERLTNKDLNELCEKLIFPKYDYAMVKEIDEDFLKNNGLKENQVYEQIPECFKNIKETDSGKLFLGYIIKNIKLKNTELEMEIKKISFTYFSWTDGYWLDDMSSYLTINDFRTCSIFPPSINGMVSQKDWYKFMYSKFGEEYLTALKSYIKNENDKKIKELRKKMDNNIQMLDEITRDN